MIMAAVQIAKRNGNPIQLFCVSLMMACMTFGPIIEDYMDSVSALRCGSKWQTYRTVGDAE